MWKTGKSLSCLHKFHRCFNFAFWKTLGILWKRVSDFLVFSVFLFFFADACFPKLVLFGFFLLKSRFFDAALQHKKSFPQGENFLCTGFVLYRKRNFRFFYSAFPKGFPQKFPLLKNLWISFLLL